MWYVLVPGTRTRSKRIPFFYFVLFLSLIHISEPTRLGMISYAVFCLKTKKVPIYRKKVPRLCFHFSLHFPAKTPEFRGPLSKIFWQVRGMIFRPFPAPETMDSVWPICRKKFQDCGLIFPSISGQNPRISGATFQDFYQVTGMISRPFPAPETMDSVWPICRKKFQDCGLTLRKFF